MTIMTEIEAIAIVEMVTTLIRDGCKVTILSHREEEDGIGNLRRPYVVSVDYGDSMNKAFGKNFLLIDALSEAYVQVPEVLS